MSFIQTTINTEPPPTIYHVSRFLARKPSFLPHPKNKTSMNPCERYVLMTVKGTYFVEFLIGTLVLSENISEATVFDCPEHARKFCDYLDENCEMEFSINTFIPID